MAQTMAGLFSPNKRVAIDTVLYPRYVTGQEGEQKQAQPFVHQHKKQAAQPTAVATTALFMSSAMLAAAQVASTAGAATEAVQALERKALKRAKREQRHKEQLGAPAQAPQAVYEVQPVQPATAHPLGPRRAKKSKQNAEAPAAAPVQHQVQTQPQAQAPVQAAPAVAAGNAHEAARIRATLGYAPQAAPVVTAKPLGNFSFGFSPAQQQVEQETQAKITRILALDSTKDGYVERRVRAYWEFCGAVESMDLLVFKDSGRFNGAAFVTFRTKEGHDTALSASGSELEGRKIRVEKCKVPAPKKNGKRDAPEAPSPAPVPQPRPQPQPQFQTYPPPAPQPQFAAPQPQFTHTPQPQFGVPAPALASAPATFAFAPAPPSASVQAAAPADENVAYVGNIAFEATEGELQALFSDCGAVTVRLHTDKHTGKPKGFAHVHFSSPATLSQALQLDGAQLHGRGLKVLPSQPKKK